MAMTTTASAATGTSHRRRVGGSVAGVVLSLMRLLLPASDIAHAAEIDDDVAHALIPVVGVFHQTLADDALKLGSDGGVRDVISGGVAVRIALSVSAVLPRRKGATPVTSSCRRTPNEKMSLRESTDAPRACSGDM